MRQRRRWRGFDAGLLGAGLLGAGGGNRHIGPPYYLLNDTFTSDRAAGAVNGTNAEPGPGRRSVTDGNSKMSLSGGQLVVVTGGVGQANPQLLLTPVSRTPGRLVVAQVGGITETFAVGFDAATASPVTSGAAAFGIRFAGSSRTLQIYSSALPLSVGNWAAATTYQIAVVARETAASYFIKGGAFTNWTLLWTGALGAFGAAPLLYPAFVPDAATAVYVADYIRVPSALWLPSPLISDGFSAWGAADGLGHAEGIAGGLGSGGSGLTYTVTGTWGAAGGVASASALSSGSAIAYADTGKADVIVRAAFTRSGGDGGLLLRFADSNNFMSCRHDGTNVVLIKKVAGSNTTVRTTPTAYVARAELTAMLEGTKVRIYYNNALVGAEDTIADAALVAATRHGLYTTNTGNSFDNLVCYSRGSGGEYAALDAF